MSLIYITGPSGAGKSSLTRQLISRGFEAHDSDDEICQWFNRTTGKQVAYPKDLAMRPEGWQEEHIFLMSEKLIEEIKERAINSTIFILGQSPNDTEIADKYFDKVLCLEIDKNTMLERIASRTNNKYGKSPDQLAIIEKWYEPTLERYRRYGATMIDATQPIEQVVTIILRQI